MPDIEAVVPERPIRLRSLPRRPRVLLVAQPTVDGVGICVEHLARAGMEAGYRITVACPDSGRLADWARSAGVHRPLDLRRRPGVTDTRSIGAIRHLLAGCDLVHLHSSKAGAVGRIALATMPASRRPPCVFSPHGWSWLVGGPGAPVYRIFERLAAGRAEVIVAVSEAEARLGWPVLRRGRLEVIENGVDLETYVPPAYAVRREQEPLVVCVGRLCRQKGQDVAVQALKQLPRPIRLRLVGTGPDEAALRALAAKSGVSSRVEFIGEVTDPVIHFQSAQVVVIPSRWDGMSLALLEAMACGAPIVASAVPGTEALAGGAGVVVSPEDPDALAGAIAALVADPRRRADLGRQARRRAENRFSLDRSLQRTLTLWEELVA